MRGSRLGIVAVVLAVLATSIGQAAASSGAFSDSFSGRTLDAKRWLTAWGSAVVHDGRLELLSVSPSSASGSASALVLSRRSFGDLTFSYDATTLAQLRQPAPNPWEVSWTFFRYGDLAHYYWLALKPNGWELGKKNGGALDGSAPQLFLATGSQPTFPVGRRYRVQISAVGGAIAVTVNGEPLLTYTDPSPLPAGAIGLYEEDSRVTFDNVAVSGS